MPQKKKKKTASNWAAPTTTVVVRNTLMHLESNLPDYFSTSPILLLLLNSLPPPFLPLNLSYQQDSQNQQDDADQKDVLACLDELDTLVSVASISETDCIVGIKKADRALELCERDGDLQCAILMKRAQLLKSVVSIVYIHCSSWMIVWYKYACALSLSVVQC